jgi:hypothetical protein
MKYASMNSSRVVGKICAELHLNTHVHGVQTVIISDAGERTAWTRTEVRLSEDGSEIH